MITPQTTSTPSKARHPVTFIITVLVLIVIGSGVALLDAYWRLNTALLESIHAVTLTILFLIGLVAHQRNPSIRQFGWYDILIGMGLLAMGSWVDILDQFDVVVLGIPMGHTWQQAFLEKILGYTVGIGFIGLGFYQWLPWMIRTRRSVERLNTQLTETLTQLDERVEEQRLSISRELHDDVAQRLTALGFTTQLCQATVQGIETTSKSSTEKASQQLKTIQQDISESLKTIRQVCRNLRPDILDVVGFSTAVSNHIEQLANHHLEFSFNANIKPDVDSAISTLEDSTQLHLFRLVQESIRNSVKHSDGNTVTITAHLENNTIYLTVLDNGNGVFWQGNSPTTGSPDNQTLVNQGHLGVAGLRERAQAIGGEYLLGNRTNQTGAEAIIICPLTPSNLSD